MYRANVPCVVIKCKFELVSTVVADTFLLLLRHFYAFVVRHGFFQYKSFAAFVTLVVFLSRVNPKVGAQMMRLVERFSA